MTSKFYQRIVFYVLVLVGVIVPLIWFVHSMFPRNNSAHWLVILNYFLLSILNGIFWIVKNVFWQEMKSLLFSLGVFFNFIGFLLLALGVAYVTPVEFFTVWGSLLSVIGLLVTAFGWLRWVQYSTAVTQGFKLQSEKDLLTSLLNRRAWIRQANVDVLQAIKTQTSLSLLLIDIDDFKIINDQYGHDTGDQVLKKIASILTMNFRKTDRIYRWGGEEFVMLFPMVSIREAQLIADKILTLVHEQVFKLENSSFQITVSIGVAQWQIGESITNGTFKRADRALYEAKKQGKNRALVG